MIKRRVRAAAERLVGASLNARLERDNDAVRFAIGGLESRLAEVRPAPSTLQDTEFKVFSQWGEDGIIDHLVTRLRPPDVFVEIGVDDYTEANTRFLAMKSNWRGAILNGGTAHEETLRRTGMAWRWSITPVSAFVTAENVDALITGAGVSGDIGLLSVDVDGVDYWLWNAVESVRPWIVVSEFNSVFGADHAVTVPYDPAFVAATAHYTGQYFGASLGALRHLAAARGYRLVGVGSNGVNAFFVRDDVAGDLWDLTAAEAYVRSRIRTARTPEGTLAYTGDDHAALLRSMRDMPLYVIDEDRERTVADLYGV